MTADARGVQQRGDLAAGRECLGTAGVRDEQDAFGSRRSLLDGAVHGGTRPSGGAPARSHRKYSTLPAGPGKRARGDTRARPARWPRRPLGDRRDRLGPQRRVAHDAARAEPLPADLELRLDHQDEVGVRRRARRPARAAPARAR